MRACVHERTNTLESMHTHSYAYTRGQWRRHALTHTHGVVTKAVYLLFFLCVCIIKCVQTHNCTPANGQIMFCASRNVRTLCVRSCVCACVHTRGTGNSAPAHAHTCSNDCAAAAAARKALSALVPEIYVRSFHPNISGRPLGLCAAVVRLMCECSMCVRSLRSNVERSANVCGVL